MLRFVHHLSLRPRAALRAPGRASSALWRGCAPDTALCPPTMAKRKRSAQSGVAAAASLANTPDYSALTDLPRTSRAAVPRPTNVATQQPTQKPPRRQSSRGLNSAISNPNVNPDILDGVSALRASPDSREYGALEAAQGPRTHHPPTAGNDPPAPGHATTEIIAAPTKGRAVRGARNAAASASESIAADLPDRQPGKNKRKQASPQHVKVDSAEHNGISTDKVTPKHVNRATASGSAIEEAVGVTADPEVDGENDDDDGDVKEAVSRPPPVNSSYLPLPWKGRLGYACLNTYLRNANPPVFSSRTCRIASILEHRHPLKDPSEPEHATKNRPDKDQPADVTRGQRYVEKLGLANARDIVKMVRWNDKFGIKFMRLSSEMFPFASHEEYGYKLEPFAADTLAEAGKVIAELGHRVTTHPGQFTQLGSPRKTVIDNSMRDLEYHAELLSLLKLPPQQDRDAVMILHLGGAFDDKPAAIARFRENYARLPQGVKNRLVLENDDVVYSVHEILSLCQELNIPMVLDFHHHNILFDAEQLREGTKDIMDMFPAILETWTKKGITPKMHYSEPCPDATTGRARRKHSPRVMTLPPCPATMDLMIEAKDKEQAVFELMRTFKLPGFDLFNDVIPHVRHDENKPFKPKPKKAVKKSRKKKTDDLEDLDEKLEDAEQEELAPAIVPDEDIAMGGPDRRVYWPPGMEDWLRPAKRIVKNKNDGAAATPAAKKRKTAAAADDASLNGDVDAVKMPAKKPAAAPKKRAPKKAPAPKAVPTPSATDDEADSSPLSDLGDDDEPHEDVAAPAAAKRKRPTRQRSGRVGRMSYKEDEGEMSV
ncbi:UV-endonuclease UvdE-domain-containing protein [Massariosphaeria phaeospora]|uniref:UV-endonuclease UvdE-domain-containing protein n=1 Tax=Massariosphaeria phaeospora TaxID=100035 RepID=A0A7C8MMZ5_9PLEO|nr:UV-endonuclease UvdE-domain-containing protein [Massariosphaeria phaeospora]